MPDTLIQPLNSLNAPFVGCELTILMPCLNEAETLAICIAKAIAYLERSGVQGEVLIADNGSTDGSQAIAAAAGARVVAILDKGYGSALLGGIRAANGRYVIMGDSDDSYDFGDLDRFVEKLRDGYDLVMGNRFKGGIMPGAMPPLHRYLGNPVLTAVGRIFFRSPCGDFASEMVVKATVHGLKITEVPTTLSPDGRSRPPHLRSWRDGWRHLRFLLLFSPRWLFLYPGVGLMAFGAAMMVWLLPAPRMVGSVTLDIHTLFYASLAVVVGFHSALFYLFARLYGMREGLSPVDEQFLRMTKTLTLEAGLLAGLVLLLAGVGLAIFALSAWSRTAFGALSPEFAMRLVIPSGTCILLAFQTAYGAFFLSVLEIRSSKRAP
jgi:glycosyltransferase involved in cell wall biosynthesis